MILSYNDYQTNKQLVEARQQLLINIFNQFEDIKPVINEAIAIVEAGVFDMVFESEELLSEETLVQRMKQKFDQAVQTAKTKGKEALTDTQQKIIQLGGSIGNVIKLMVQKLKEWVSNTFAAAKQAYQKAAQSKAGEIEKKLGDNKDQKLLIKEVKQLKQVAAAFTQWLTAGFVKDTVAGAAEVAKEDVKEAFELALIEAINEAVVTGQVDFTDMLAEAEGGIPFVSTIAHKLHHVPPFNLLDKVKQAAEKVSGGALNRLSFYATKLAGAPGPYEFVALASLIGIVAEVQFKGVAKHAILHAVPGLKTIASLISNVAMALAVIAIIETLMKKEGEDAHH